MPGKRLVVTVVAVLFGIGAVAACSGDDSSDDEGPESTELFIPNEPLEQDDYERRAEQLCEETVQGDNGLDAGDLPTTPEELEAEHERLTLAFEELGHIPPPEGQQEAFQSFIDQADLVLVTIEELAQARTDGDDDLASSLEDDLVAAVEELETIGDDVGLSACADVLG